MSLEKGGQQCFGNIPRNSACYLKDFIDIVKYSFHSIPITCFKSILWFENFCKLYKVSISKKHLEPEEYLLKHCWKSKSCLTIFCTYLAATVSNFPFINFNRELDDLVAATTIFETTLYFPRLAAPSQGLIPSFISREFWHHIVLSGLVAASRLNCLSAS